MLTALSAAAAAAAAEVPFLQLDQPAGCRVAILPRIFLIILSIWHTLSASSAAAVAVEAAIRFLLLSSY